MNNRGGTLAIVVVLFLAVFAILIFFEFAPELAKQITGKAVSDQKAMNIPGTEYYLINDEDSPGTFLFNNGSEACRSVGKVCTGKLKVNCSQMQDGNVNWLDSSSYCSTKKDDYASQECLYAAVCKLEGYTKIANASVDDVDDSGFYTLTPLIPNPVEKGTFTEPFKYKVEFMSGDLEGQLFNIITTSVISSYSIFLVNFGTDLPSDGDKFTIYFRNESHVLDDVGDDNNQTDQNQTQEDLCGNGVIDSSDGEQCDDPNLAGETCQTRGFDSGDLGCTNECMFDTSSCVKELPAQSDEGGSAKTKEEKTSSWIWISLLITLIVLISFIGFMILRRSGNQPDEESSAMQGPGMNFPKGPGPGPSRPQFQLKPYVGNQKPFYR